MCEHLLECDRDVRRHGDWYVHATDDRHGADAALFVSGFTLTIAEPPSSAQMDHRAERFLREGLERFLVGVHRNPPRLHWWQLRRRRYACETFELTHTGDIIPYAIPEVL